MNFNVFPLILSSLVLISCTTTSLSRSTKKEAKNVCMNSEGKGRLSVKGKKYVFDYESILDESRAKWVLLLSFPLRSEEKFELDWSRNGKMYFKSSIDTKILRENRDINPKELDYFVNSIGHFLKDLIKLKSNKKSKLRYQWKIDKKTLTAQSKSKRSTMLFTNFDSEGYFGLMSVGYQGKKNQSYKMDFIVRKCFKNEVSDSDTM